MGPARCPGCKMQEPCLCEEHQKCARRQVSKVHQVYVSKVHQVYVDSSLRSDEHVQGCTSAGAEGTIRVWCAVGLHADCARAHRARWRVQG